MPSHEVKNMSASKDIKEFKHARMELVDIAGHTVARFTLKKGWKWSDDVKPVVKTEWCMAPHMQYVISGKFRARMKDGTEFDIGPGDVAYIPPGHDAWVVGNEPVVGIEFVGGRVAAEGPKKK
jgi:mannose-6-phosphate isomerase-like protein (cupin superfamily)